MIKEDRKMERGKGKGGSLLSQAAKDAKSDDNSASKEAPTLAKAAEKDANSDDDSDSNEDGTKGHHNYDKYRRELWKMIARDEAKRQTGGNQDG